jgi:hypothetical protein
MKLILTASLAALIATGAVAGNSDRYNDQRLDTSNAAQATTTDSQAAAAVATLSTRSAAETSTSYPYINPYGIGPNNDSR